MINHVDEDASGEIEIHEFLKLMDDIEGASLAELVAAVAAKLAFNLGAVASKYELEHAAVAAARRGHRKRALTLSGRLTRHARAAESDAGLAPDSLLNVLDELDRNFPRVGAAAMVSLLEG
jgi:hypothetical protein